MSPGPAVKTDEDRDGLYISGGPRSRVGRRHDRQEVLKAIRPGAGASGRRISTTCQWPWRQRGHRVGSTSAERASLEDVAGSGAPRRCCARAIRVRRCRLASNPKCRMRTNVERDRIVSEGRVKQEAQPVHGNVAGTPCELPLLNQMQQIRLHFVVRNLIRRPPVKLRQASHRLRISRSSSGFETVSR